MRHPMTIRRKLLSSNARKGLLGLLVLLTIYLVSTFWLAVTLHSSDAQGGLGPLTAFNNTRMSSNLPQKPLWKTKTNIPDWMKKYMDWHTKVVSTLNETNWKNYNYLLLQCFRSDLACGGISDRLKPIPLELLAANQSKRILFIQWDRPCRLEEFLEPPVGGFQWSVPDFLASTFRNHTGRALSRAKFVIESSKRLKDVIVGSHVHTTLGGSTEYNEVEGDGAFERVFHDAFQVMFQPTAPIQRLINERMRTGGLVPGEYSVAHYRAEYGKEVDRHPILLDPEFVRRVAQNAIRCASELQPEQTLQRKPIFFASDNSLALGRVRGMARDNKYPIVTYDRQEDAPLHLDFDGNETHPTFPQNYYSTFVDLFIAGSGKCVTHGRGGYGRFASLMSYNVSCVSKHVTSFFPNVCEGIVPFKFHKEE